MTAADGGPGAEWYREAAAEYADPPARPRPHVLGIDLSLTAAAVASSAGWVEVTGAPSQGARYTDRLLRVHDVTAAVVNLITPSRTDLVLIEGPAYSRGADPSAFDRAFLWWLIFRYCWSAHIPAAIVTPGQLKLYATGKGTASKGAVIDAAARRWPEYATQGDDNAADAVTLLALGLDYLGHPLAVMPAVNRAVLGRIDWPELGVKRCICGPADPVSEAPDMRPDCVVHGVNAIPSAAAR